jgi:hypothetical protein
MKLKPVPLAAVPQALGLLVVISVAFSNISIIPIASGFKISHISAAVIIAWALSKGVNRSRLLITVAACLIPLLSFLNLVNYQYFSLAYANWILVVGLVIIGVKAWLTYFSIEAFRFLTTTALWSFLITALFGIVQFIFNNFTDIEVYNFFGPFQAHPHFENTVYGLQRSTSVFFEPSQFGVFTLFSLTIAIYAYKYGIISRSFCFTCSALMAAGIFSSLSATALIGFFLSAVYYLALARLNLILKFILLFISVALGVGANYWDSVFALLRLGSIGVSGTSGNTRVEQSFYVLGKIIEMHPLFGIGLGQSSLYSDGSLDNAVVHNAFASFFIVFGLLGGLILLSLIMLSVCSYARFTRYSLPVLFSILYTYASNGSFNSFEVPFLVFIASSAFGAISGTRVSRICGLRG